MFSKECVKCEKMFECAGKPTKGACLQFEDRNGAKKNDTKQQKEGRKI